MPVGQKNEERGKAGFGNGGHVNLEGVLRLLDARTGSYAEVRPSRPGLLRVSAQVPTDAGTSDITGLRVLLVADLLARIAELRNLQVFTVLAYDAQPGEQLAALERAVDALGMHRPAARASSSEASVSLGGPIDVHLVSNGPRADDRPSGFVSPVGNARIHRAGEGLLAGHQPAAVRLALLSFPYQQPADLTEAVLADAQATVGRWRLLVAEWAESPSRPIPKPIAEKVREIFDDLDTVSALALLADLASDAALPVGAKFETFVYADRILGLDLPLDIGRAARLPRWPSRHDAVELRRWQVPPGGGPRRICAKAINRADLPDGQWVLRSEHGR